MITATHNPNRITLLFPLYKSKQFVPNLITHIDQFVSDDVNIIVSDRHCFDDAVEILREHYRGDHRIQFFKATDGINWVDHFNLLIRQVSGKYFSFVFHDDRYPPDYFPVLANELDHNETAVLAFGHMNVAGDKDWIIDHSIFKVPSRYPYPVDFYMRLLYSNRIGVAFRGLFRTATIVGEELFIRQNDEVTQYQDYYWIFALMERGDFIYTEKTFCTKHFRDEGASGKWSRTQFFRKNAAAREMIYDYTRSSPLPALTKIRLITGLKLRALKVKMTTALKS